MVGILSSGVFSCRRFALLLAACSGFAAAQTITNVVNAASWITQGLPNSGIAQGSVFTVIGTGLGPSTLAVAPAPFQNTSLGGTSVSVTVNSTTVNALMYYTSATQVAALLPSNTPTGSGAITVTYNGSPGGSEPISVVANNIGIFTISSNGAGVGILTYPDYSLVSSVPGTGALADTCTGSELCPDTYGGAANVGDTLTIWATGLGPVSGSDASGAGLGQNMPNISLQVWLGGVSAPVTYQGRSGCCIGEDQINFTVPGGVPLGCAVPLMLQIGTVVSNSVMIPVASGSRSCTPQSPVFATAGQTINYSNGPINYGFFSLNRAISSEGSSGITYEDVGSGYMAQILPTSPYQPMLLSTLDLQAFGTCSIYNSVTQNQPPFTVVTGLDAGTVTVTGPSGPVTMHEQPESGIATDYSALFSPLGVYFSQGSYTLAAAGGKTVGSFKVPFTITQTPAWPSSDQAALVNGAGGGVTRSKGMTITWTGGSSAYYLEIDGTASTVATDTNNTVGGGFTCLVPSTLNTFTVPATVLYALPSAAVGEIDFKPSLNPIGFSANGLDIGYLALQYDTAFWPVTFN